MKLNSLSALSLEKLKQKKRTYIILLTIFAVLLSLLIMLTTYMYITSGWTPLIAIPISLFPLFLVGCKSLRTIYKEIEFRLVSSTRAH
jgi:hypothetical protein